jgi:hypothetical protein
MINVYGYIYPDINSVSGWRQACRVTIFLARREFTSALRAVTPSTESAAAIAISAFSFRLT